MARDLIPPPSPAGRPEIEGTPTHRFVELPPEPVAEAPAPPKVEQKLNLPPTQYRNRFGFLAGALGGVVLGSIALAIALFAYSDKGSDDYGMHPNWSAWQPDDETLADGASQIATHVGTLSRRAKLSMTRLSSRSRPTSGELRRPRATRRSRARTP